MKSPTKVSANGYITEKVKPTQDVLKTPWRPKVYTVWRKSQRTGKRVRVQLKTVRSRAPLVPSPKKQGTRIVISGRPKKRGRVPVWRSLVKRTTPLVNPYVRSQTNTRRFYTYWKFGVALSLPYNEASYSVNFTKSRTGNFLPRWREIIRQGGNATTTMTASADFAEEKPAYCEVTYSARNNPSSPWELRQYWHDFTNFHVIAPIGHFSNEPDAKAQDQAVKALYSKIRSARHQLQGGVILGEIDKTARLLVGTARNLKQGVFNYLGQAVGIRRGKGTGASKQKALANTYLEHVFGWQPLIHDMKDAASALGRLCHESDRARFTAVGSSTSVTASTAGEIINSVLKANRTHIDQTETVVIYKGFLRTVPYEAGSPPLERIVQMSGFDLGSFIPSMWELVPYSFLVDYFTNIGDCLYALSTDTSIVKSLSRTQRKESSRIYSIVPNVAKSVASVPDSLNVKNARGSGEAGLVTITHRDVTRAQAPVPIMVPQLTGLDLPWKQFANIGALIVGKSR